MTDKHTPGPWHVVTMHGWGGLCIGRRPQDEADKTAGDAPIAKVIEKAPHWQDAFPAEANARLIAAAPDLLEALREVSEWIGNWDPNFTQDDEWPATAKKMADVLAKAEA